MLTFKRTNSKNEHFKELLVLLDAHLKIKDGDDHTFYNQYNKVDTIKHVIVSYLNEVPVGCGAFKDYQEGIIEIKRMYVLETARGNQLGTKILKELEDWAKEIGFTHSILETGGRMPDAIALYKKNGYRQIANYGQYIGMDNSRCFKKKL